MQFTRNRDITLHFQVFGAPEGRPVLVFINALGTDFRIWRDVVVALAGEATILTYDMRGHGLSDVGAPPYANADHVDDLKCLLDEIGVDKVVLCGLSVGGQIALGFYERYPARVAGLILSDTAHKIGDAETWNDRIATVEAEGIPALSEGTLQRWFTPAFRQPGNAAFSGYRNMLERQDVRGYAGTAASVRDADFTELLPRIAVPVLCLVGDQDGSTPPALVKSMAEAIPGARYEVIVNAGHLPGVEQPQTYADLVGGFLAEVQAKN